MRVIGVNNVCQALDRGVALLLEHGREEPSRAGPVLVAPWPVTTVYRRPRERVLFSPLRDANPFFHLCESMWMIAGRRDAAFLNNFVGDFGERFAEPDGNIHDAYGFRWRHVFDYDQLDAVVKHLGNDPTSRQAVVTMWDAGRAASNDLLGKWRTRPCNTHAYLRIRDDAYRDPPVTDENSAVHEERISRGGNLLLDLTVLCRSNDIWWGAYGANAVHFSVLQEYLAARLDVGVGTMYQVSNNYHIYLSQLEQLEKRKSQFPRQAGLWDDRYKTEGLRPSPLVHDAESLDEEVRHILHYYENPPPECLPVENFNNKFLSLTVWPMLLAHHHWRQKNYEEAASWLEQIDAADWRAAATEWVARRKK